MLIRFKWWKQTCLADGTSNHCVSCPGQPDGKAVFTFANEGLCDVKTIRGVEFLLKTPYNYEIAYEKYGISWDAEGRQIEPELPDAQVTQAEPVITATMAGAMSELGVEPPKRGKGRPKGK